MKFGNICAETGVLAGTRKVQLLSAGSWDSHPKVKSNIQDSGQINISLFFYPVPLSSSVYKRRVETAHFLSLNCNGSEDHLIDCFHNSSSENAACVYIATALCEGI